jgi:hypothetical protein
VQGAGRRERREEEREAGDKRERERKGRGLQRAQTMQEGAAKRGED